MSGYRWSGRYPVISQGNMWPPHNGAWYDQSSEGRDTLMGASSGAYPAALNASQSQSQSQSQRASNGLGPQYASPSSTEANFGSVNSTGTLQEGSRPRAEDIVVTIQDSHNQVGNWMTEQFARDSRAYRVRNVVDRVDQQIPQQSLQGRSGQYASELEVSDEGESESSNRRTSPRSSSQKRTSFDSRSVPKDRSRSSKSKSSESDARSADSKPRKKRGNAK